MDDETAIAAVLVPPQLKRFREVCEVAGPIEPRFDGYTKHVLLTEDRAFLFPRNHTIVAQLERECDVYATVDHPLVSKLLGRWDEPAISPYPFFAVTRLRGSVPGDMSPEHPRRPVRAEASSGGSRSLGQAKQSYPRVMQDLASGEETGRRAVGLSPFYGLLRVRPLVLDTGPLTTDVIRAARRGEPSPLALAMLVGVVRGYAARHVWAEVPRVLAKRAPRAAVPAAALEKLWWESYVPLIHFVDTDGLPMTEESRALAKRDASDAPTLVLAGLLAPAVIIAEDRDILATGLAYEQWREFYDVVRTLNTGRTNVQGASLLLSLGTRGAMATMRSFAKLGASPMRGALAAIALLGLGAAAYRWSPEIRAIWSRTTETRIEIVQRLSTTFLAFSERLQQTELTWSGAERGARQPALVNRIAATLATAESPRTRTNVVAALRLPRQLGMLEVTQVLHSYPAFVQPTQHRWQLGRDGMDFGGLVGGGTPVPWPR